jgi:ATP-binding cassette, subfamily C (CFTR/MRP), member 1
VASMERIQNFLLGNSRVDLRRKDKTSSRTQKESELHSEEVVIPTAVNLVELTAAISINTPTISPSWSADTVLSNIDISLDRSTITLVAGPIGSGKSTLLKAILGEVLFTGNISVSSDRIAYCAPNPWLMNDTVRQNVLGLADQTEIDEAWYQTVMNACALVEDIVLLSDGDQTVIGSRGLTLSGGQRQRLLCLFFPVNLI